MGLLRLYETIVGLLKLPYSQKTISGLKHSIVIDIPLVVKGKVSTRNGEKTIASR
jgi:hypothetical protein